MKTKKQKIIYLIYSLVALISLFAVSQKAMASQITPQRVVELVNESRTQEGVKVLKTDDVLTKVAQDKLDDMITNGYFAHTSPNGTTPWHWFQKNKYDYKYAGENLAMNFVDAETEHRAWMDSPSHKKNMLNPIFKEIGVAVGAGEVNGKTVILAVQEFGTPTTSVQGSNNSDNFSADTNLDKAEKENDKPAVLSTKNIFDDTNIGPQQSGNKNKYLVPLGESIDDPKALASDIFERLALLFMLSAIMAIPLSFVVSALHRIWITKRSKQEKGKAIPIKFLDNVQKATKIKVHLA